MTIFRGPGGTGSASSDSDTTEFQEFLVQSQAARDAALAAQVAAELAETNAETAETNAETAETNAETAATNAASSASAAASSASSASSSATSAANSATAAAASAASINPADLVHISGAETITGAKTFSQPITGSVTGNAANVTGTVAVANGGTSSTTASAARTALGLAIGTNVQAYSPNLSAYASTGIGFRNRIINGNMRIDQRNAGASVAITTSGNYTVDRWSGNATQNGKYTVQQNAGSVTPPAGFINYLGATSSSAYSVGSGDVFWLAQGIEGLNISDLGWGAAGAQSITLSFWARSSLTGTFGGALRNAAGNRSYPFTYTISAANTWEQKSVTIAGDTSGTWLTTNGLGINLNFGLGAGATYSGTAGAWAAGNFVSATGATSVVGTSGATFYITGVQLEAGTVATPFERRDYGRELMMCQRYYETGGNYQLFSGYVVSGETYYNPVRFSVTKRNAPAVTPTYVATSRFATAAPTIAAVGSDGFWGSATATLTGTGYFQYTWVATAEL